MPFVNRCGLFTARVPLWALYYLFKFAILPLAKRLRVTHQMPFADCWHAAGCLPRMPCHWPLCCMTTIRTAHRAVRWGHMVNTAASSFLIWGCRGLLAASLIPNRLGVATSPRKHKPLIFDREALRAFARSLCSVQLSHFLPLCHAPVPFPSGATPDLERRAE